MSPEEREVALPPDVVAPDAAEGEGLSQAAQVGGNRPAVRLRPRRRQGVGYAEPKLKAMDVSVFRPDEKACRESHAVSLLYHTDERKGWTYAWEAIQTAHDEIGDLTVRMFGAHHKPPSMPPWVRYIRNASEAQLRHIYSSTSAYACASVNEGFGLTCVEAMACGCVLVVTDFEGSREYAVPHVNALVSPVADTKAMAENIVRVLTDTGLRDRLASAGMVTARTRGWDEAVAMIERALEQ